MSVDKLPRHISGHSKPVTFNLIEDTGGLTAVDVGLLAFCPDLRRCGMHRLAGAALTL
jgi:hypothetical protein